MIEIKLTEAETSIVLQALSHYMYNNPRVTEAQWEIANAVMEKIDDEV